MKSKVLVCLVLSTIFIVSSLAAESVFSNYDFTFYRTVSESLAISDSSTIGFDYTGFGFVGTRNTSGLFLRIGIQLPYTTLTNIVEGISGGGSTGMDEDEGEEPGEGLEISTGSSGDSSQMEYRLTFVLGPGIRYVFSPFFDFYAGIGPKLEEHIMSTSYSHSTRSESTYNTSLALDMDIGFKFNLEKNTSCRIGVYSTFEILSYTYSKIVDGAQEAFTTSNIHLNAIATGQTRNPLSAVGYISVGKTFNSELKGYVYRYETTSPVLGQGTATPIARADI